MNRNIINANKYLSRLVDVWHTCYALDLVEDSINTVWRLLNFKINYTVKSYTVRLLIDPLSILTYKVKLLDFINIVNIETFAFLLAVILEILLHFVLYFWDQPNA